MHSFHICRRSSTGSRAKSKNVPDGVVGVWLKKVYGGSSISGRFLWIGFNNLISIYMTVIIVYIYVS